VKPVTIPTLPHTVYHWSPSREDKTRPVPRNLGDSALSIRSRPGLDPTSTLHTVQRQGKDDMARCSGSFRRLVSHDAMVSRDGRPFPRHVATVNSTGIDETSPPVVLASSRPIKGQARVLRRERNEAPDHTTTDNEEKTKDRYFKQPSLSFFPLFETWARRPLSPACNPYTSTSVQGNTNFFPPLDIGTSFAQTRINPRVFSLHHHPGKRHAVFTRWFRTPSGPNTDSGVRGVVKAFLGVVARVESKPSFLVIALRSANNMWAQN
jgi:hypothetical protein